MSNVETLAGKLEESIAELRRDNELLTLDAQKLARGSSARTQLIEERRANLGEIARLERELAILDGGL